MKKIIDWIKNLFKSSPKKSDDSSSENKSNGFTLIELLIVIAVLGVLAAVVLIAIDPIEQLGRGRDSGRKTSVTGIGRAIQTYYTAVGSYPAEATYNTILTTSGELKPFPPAPGGSPPALGCTGGTAVSGFCYKSNGTDYVVYSKLESKVERNKGNCANVAANTWYVFSSAAGKAGVVCQAGEPAEGFNGTFY
ncbi:MAG: hypothetical protein US96_C0038G0004 [Candidatus Woesebacteria bacterium GW2011_GWB1_38_5b]|uniref:Uncharacterized protein n=1 Tax=Candidatus Woesebacteria bacterium GW2011_GWB1_38_5b TaxID=1618569 RepID=A0A0G0K5Y2_9BACT|nr:MAG: hypothetical protein US96_C0038G0004 [Candidatus Woesebacteria bacterium GW2011_GWB1_38_5b]OGH47508.1 MAG: hypothetical protein A3A51_02880 [Candidatus Levybacteria bacterium RIFCSPLOWO2_01_FULL_39_10]